MTDNNSVIQRIADLAQQAWGTDRRVVVMISATSCVVVEDGGSKSALFRREVTADPVQAALDYFQAEILLRSVGQGEDIMRVDDPEFWL